MNSFRCQGSLSMGSALEGEQIRNSFTSKGDFCHSLKSAVKARKIANLCQIRNYVFGMVIHKFCWNVLYYCYRTNIICLTLLVKWHTWVCIYYCFIQFLFCYKCPILKYTPAVCSAQRIRLVAYSILAYLDVFNKSCIVLPHHSFVYRNILIQVLKS